MSSAFCARSSSPHMLTESVCETMPQADVAAVGRLEVAFLLIRAVSFATGSTPAADFYHGSALSLFQASSAHLSGLTSHRCRWRYPWSPGKTVGFLRPVSTAARGHEVHRVVCRGSAASPLPLYHISNTRHRSTQPRRVSRDAASHPSARRSQGGRYHHKCSTRLRLAEEGNEWETGVGPESDGAVERVRGDGDNTKTTGSASTVGGWQSWVDDVKEKVKSAMPEPIEAKKVLPLGLMLFFILFDYTILRDTKDVLVVTAKGSGAEVIPFLKTYVNLPGAVVFTLLYSKLCNSAKQDNVFYTVIAVFLGFFTLFAAVLYPNRDVLSTAGLADSMQAFLPEGLSALSSIVRNWTFSLFYLMSELWGSVVVSVLFWGFANDIVSVSEAKRFYPLFGLGANVALIFSGQYVRMVSNVRQSLPPDVDRWGVSLQLLMVAVVAGGVVVTACYRWMQENVVTDIECVDATRLAGMTEKTSLTLKESAVFLANNAYLRDVAMLVISYGTSINIVEVTWKAKLKVAYPDPNDYSAFMGNFSSTTGAVTLIMMLLGRQVFEKYGWGAAAKVTPLVLLGTGAAFFSLSMFGDSASVQSLLATFSTNPLALAVLAGAAQNVLSKSCKYSLFDPCKEMAYIPLSPEEKRKGKAAVDVIGNPLGKSTGSFVQQGLFLATGSLQASTPYLGGVLFGVISTWLLAAESLSKKFEAAMEEAEVAETAARSPSLGVPDMLSSSFISRMDAGERVVADETASGSEKNVVNGNRTDHHATDRHAADVPNEALRAEEDLVAEAGALEVTGRV